MNTIRHSKMLFKSVQNTIPKFTHAEGRTLTHHYT